MGLSEPFNSLFVLLALLLLRPPSVAARNSNLFRDSPTSGVEFHFILSFAIDYTTSSSPSHTNGKFNVFWDSDNLGPSQVSTIKRKHSNVKVALSLGGETVENKKVFFKPSSVDSWVSNAVSSLTHIIKQYHLDGIDIDYEHFAGDPETFANCVGRLITTLKKNKVNSFASIAPLDDANVQKHYLALLKSYGHVVDYVNFQFYEYAAGTAEAYDGSGGLSPQNGFFKPCQKLKNQGKLGEIFVWSADDSKKNGFRYAKEAQALLASRNWESEIYSS
ncbi:Chitinase [Bertholletia excelsa]